MPCLGERRSLGRGFTAVPLATDRPVARGTKFISTRSKHTATLTPHHPATVQANRSSSLPITTMHSQ